MMYQMTQKSTFDALGIPEGRKRVFSRSRGSSDSEIVYHSIKEDLVKQGVIYTDFDDAVKSIQS